MSTLLIIGGTGFFGKSILDSFQRGQLDEWGVDRVIAMARKADRLRLEAPDLLSDRVELKNADIATTDWLPSADYVIHAAASSDARNYLNQPEVERQNILAGVYNYCRLAPKYHQNSKIVYASSGAVYGTQPPDLEHLEEGYEFKDASDIPEGKRDYAIAKRDAELAFIKLASAGLNVSIARCFTFIGRWLPRDQHFAAGNFVEDVLNERSIQIKTKSPVFRSYMYADDLVYWLMKMAFNSNSNVEIFNVGSNVAVDIKEFGRLFADEYGLDVLWHSYLEYKIDRYVPSTNKAKKNLELEIKTDLISAIRLTVSGLMEKKKNFDL